jgi:hypothetical protein
MLTRPHIAPSPALTGGLPASDSVEILCGDATARPFVSEDAHRAGTAATQGEHLSSLLTECIFSSKTRR